jgi:hypothetical protein
MMILGSIKPFTFAQKILVLNDEGAIEATITTSMKDFAENLCEVANKYNCKNVKIAGYKTYAKGLENKIKDCYLAKYEKNDLEIEYI